MRLLSHSTASPVALILTLTSLCHVINGLPQESDNAGSDSEGGLQIETLSSGDCETRSQNNDVITVHYVGTLEDGTVFDSSYIREVPFEFQIGQGTVIKGWDEGLLDMCIGEERRLTIPPEMGYGDEEQGPIPANSVLFFDTKLMAINGVFAEIPAQEAAQFSSQPDQPSSSVATGIRRLRSSAVISSSAIRASRIRTSATPTSVTPISDVRSSAFHPSSARTTAVRTPIIEDEAPYASPTSQPIDEFLEGEGYDREGSYANPEESYTDPEDSYFNDDETHMDHEEESDPLEYSPDGYRPYDTSEKDSSGTQNGKCSLLGPFALFVQAGLGLLAILSLVWKRYRERPRRTFKVWFFDVSKQVIGTAMLHVANLAMSLFSSGDLEYLSQAKHIQDANGNVPNPCSFYLINILVDTTIGVVILIVILKVLHRVFALTPLANPPESIKSGHYGHPPKATWWLKQSVIYFMGLLLMKLCVFFLFEILPWIAWVGDWALRWTEGNEGLQIAFVMFVFPLIMNAIQYYIIDSFIKDAANGEHEAVPTEEHDDHEPLHDPSMYDDEDDLSSNGDDQHLAGKSSTLVSEGSRRAEGSRGASELAKGNRKVE